MRAQLPVQMLSVPLLALVLVQVSVGLRLAQVLAELHIVLLRRSTGGAASVSTAEALFVVARAGLPAVRVE